MNIAPRSMSREALVLRCEELMEDVRRKDLVIDGNLDKIGATRALLTQANKIVSTARKGRFKLDAMSYRHIWNELFHTIAQNSMSLVGTVLGAISEGKDIKWLLIMGLSNSVLGPITMAVQKMNERH